jgi:hypothetical protein
VFAYCAVVALLPAHQVLQGALEYGKRMGICRPGDNVVAVVASFVHRDDLMMRTLAVRE